MHLHYREKFNQIRQFCSLHLYQATEQIYETCEGIALYYGYMPWITQKWSSCLYLEDAPNKDGMASCRLCLFLDHYDHLHSRYSYFDAMRLEGSYSKRFPAGTYKQYNRSPNIHSPAVWDSSTPSKKRSKGEGRHCLKPWSLLQSAGDWST